MLFHRRAVIVVLWVAMLLPAALSCDRAARPPATKPPIVLIIIDTLRADHVGSYGYARPTTPYLDRFATTAVRFSNAHAPSSWTVPSMASLFTGVYPARHGVELAATEERQVLSQQVLHEGYTTMAESLRQAGYDTYGVSANFHLHKRFGMDQGFNDYTVFRFTSRDYVDSHLQKLLPKIRRTAGERPYFLFVHYFDPHHPYRPDDSLLERFRPADAPPAAYEEWQEQWHELVNAGYFYQHPEAMQALVDAYDAEVAGCDESIAAWLEKLPHYDDALVVVTADHGEAFGDHQNMTHAGDLYAETLRVPLLVKLPGNARAGEVVDDVVNLVDLYPTFAEWAGAAKPKELVGVNLSDPQQLRRADDRLIFSTTRRIPGQHWVGVIREGVKLLYWTDENKLEAYDVRRDFGDRQNILSTLSLRQQRILQRQLLRYRLQRSLYPPKISESAQDDDLKKKMKELGYL